MMNLGDGESQMLEFPPALPNQRRVLLANVQTEIVLNHSGKVRNLPRRARVGNRQPIPNDSGDTFRVFL
jgi:hypothetical protein